MIYVLLYLAKAVGSQLDMPNGQIRCHYEQQYYEYERHDGPPIYALRCCQQCKRSHGKSAHLKTMTSSRGNLCLQSGILR
jgi:hypothetical protein